MVVKTKKNIFLNIKSKVKIFWNILYLLFCKRGNIPIIDTKTTAATFRSVPLVLLIFVNFFLCAWVRQRVRSVCKINIYFACNLTNATRHLSNQRINERWRWIVLASQILPSSKAVFECAVHSDRRAPASAPLGPSSSTPVAMKVHTACVNCRCGAPWFDGSRC